MNDRPTPQALRRFRALGAPTLVLRLAATLLVLPPLAGAAETKRFGPFENFFKPGEFHELQRELLKPDTDADRRDTIALGGVDAAKAVQARNAGLSRDARAEAYVRSVEGIVGTRLARRMAEELARRAENKPAAATTRLRMADGASVEITVEQAHEVHRAVLRSLVRLVATDERPGPSEIRGGPPARLATAGDCPIDAGAVELSRLGAGVEGRRGDRLLLLGAFGQQSAFFLLAEPAHATITVPAAAAGARPRLDIPDRPSTLYRARLAEDALKLEPVGGGSCRITITPE